MIWDGLLNALVAIVTTVVNFFPLSAGLDADANAQGGAAVAGGMAQLFGVMMTFDAVIPVHEVLNYAAMLIGLMAALYVYVGIRAVIRWVPFISRGGG